MDLLDDALRRDLEHAGLLLTAEQHGRRCNIALPPLVLTMVGMAFAVGGVIDTSTFPAVVAVVLSVAVFLMCLLTLFDPWRRTGEGKIALRRFEERHLHLKPENTPSWATYGVAMVPAGVALYGMSAFTGSSGGSPGLQAGEESGLRPELSRRSRDNSTHIPRRQ